jgi:hypothetical protein
LHGYLLTDLCALPKEVVRSMARFRLCGHNLRIETGRHEGLPRNERSCRRCKRLLGDDFVAPIDDEEHLLFSCKSTTTDERLRFAGLPMPNLRDLMQCENVGNVSWSVHECMERVNNWLSQGQSKQSTSTTEKRLLKRCSSLIVHNSRLLLVLFCLCLHRHEF